MPTIPDLHRRARRAASYAGIAAALVGAGRPLPAQVSAVDEGGFAISRGGAPFGREEFRIVRQPAGSGGAAFVARAVGAYGARRVTPALQADADGLPVRYQMDVRGGGADERISAEGGAAGHFIAQGERGGREGVREYLLTPGTVIVDDEAYHQLYFVGRRALAGATSVPVLVPRAAAQLTVTITRAGAEPVAIGGRAVPATHFALADARAGWRRELWVDSEGRVLRVVNPGLGIDAVREGPPR